MVNSYLPSRFIVSFFFFSSFLVSPGRRTVSSWNCRFFHFSFSPSLPSSLPPSFSLSYFSDFDGAALASTNVLRTIDKDEQLRISHIVLMFFFDAPFFFFFWNFAEYIYIHTYICHTRFVSIIIIVIFFFLFFFVFYPPLLLIPHERLLYYTFYCTLPVYYYYYLSRLTEIY